MVLKQIVLWWYGPGWLNSFKAISRRLELLSDDLSIEILLKTLFEPWKQIKTYAGPNASVDLKLRVMFDNIFARFFGFIIRSFVLIFASIFLVLTAFFGLLIAIIWPIVPLLPIFFIFKAVVNI